MDDRGKEEGEVTCCSGMRAEGLEGGHYVSFE